jgi:hypothetical protein
MQPLVLSLPGAEATPCTLVQMVNATVPGTQSQRYVTVQVSEEGTVLHSMSLVLAALLELGCHSRMRVTKGRCLGNHASVASQVRCSEEQLRSQALLKGAPRRCRMHKLARMATAGDAPPKHPGLPVVQAAWQRIQWGWAQGR